MKKKSVQKATWKKVCREAWPTKKMSPCPNSHVNVPLSPRKMTSRT